MKLWRKLKQMVVRPVDPELERRADAYVASISALSIKAQAVCLKHFVQADRELVRTRAVQQWAWDNRGWMAANADYLRGK